PNSSVKPTSRIDMVSSPHSSPWCHSLRPIRTEARDPVRWEGTSFALECGGVLLRRFGFCCFFGLECGGVLLRRFGFSRSFCLCSPDGVTVSPGRKKQAKPKRRSKAPPHSR